VTSNYAGASTVDWPEAMDLLGRAALAFEILAERDSRDLPACVFARLVGEVHKATQGPSPDMDPLEVR
jgi:hypothetical protein